MKIIKPDDKETLTYGKLKITLRYLNVIEGLKYVPIVTYVASNFGLDPKLIDTLNKQLKEAQKKKDEKTVEHITDQINKLARAQAVEALKKLSRSDMQTLIEFIADSIDDWSVDLEPTPENIQKLPMGILYDVMMTAIGMFVAAPGEVDFFGQKEAQEEK